jgi:hypothetical protein
MSQPPEWLQIVGVAVWSAALTVGVFWQPQWMHRLFNYLVHLSTNFRLVGKRNHHDQSA